MLIENLVIEIGYMKDSLKHVNNYIIDEILENWHSFKMIDGEIYSKIMGLLHANSSVVESLEKILITYQDEIDNNYAELLKTEI